MSKMMRALGLRVRLRGFDCGKCGWWHFSDEPDFWRHKRKHLRSAFHWFRHDEVADPRADWAHNVGGSVAPDMEG